MRILVLTFLCLSLVAHAQEQYRAGRYADLKEICDSNHAVVCVPSLVAVLLGEERKNGTALTREEVIQIRDRAAAMLVPVEKKDALIESRGYPDIDAERAWKEWQVVRRQFQRSEGSSPDETDPESAQPGATDNPDSARF